PFLPRLLATPGGVSPCHFVAVMISASVAPLARFISAITSAFLLARSPLGLVACFLAGPGFFAGLPFLAGVRFVFGWGTSGVDAFFSASVAVFISFPLTGLRS